MVIIMDIETGASGSHEMEFGAWQDEVLNAEWTPAPYSDFGQPSAEHREPRLGLQEVQVEDVDRFLRNVYLNQA
jgi:hypothetical protein